MIWVLLTAIWIFVNNITLFILHSCLFLSFVSFGYPDHQSLNVHSNDQMSSFIASYYECDLIQRQKKYCQQIYFPLKIQKPPMHYCVEYHTTENKNATFDIISTSILHTSESCLQSQSCQYFKILYCSFCMTMS